ncbi:lipase family protein [Ramlibacter albus]|uniref:Prolyl oligopeptidase family serine peptidase n=1 Tax=Ramlibacter albus TaxID=2079448 RepID=A0A923S0U4_9BURK|nr:lipase family protein [Ramlibacter albus]MBC5763581.1 prolyl oligopeptidase family serine peptidase [Ramlibacter albus]
MQKRLALTAVALASLLAACGGGSDGGADPSARGALIEPSATVATLTAAQIDASTAASGLQALSGKAKCDVRIQSINFNTIGPKGEATNSSGALLVPAGACASQSFPLVAYDRGTEVFKPRALASATDAETFSMVAFFASQGYAVVAPDYLGFAKSAFSYHPYLHAESEATTTVDAIRAARNTAAAQGFSLNGKVMVTGYSQGGHASMATHRAIERDYASEINLVAGAHLAGPYNLSGSFKLNNAIAGYQYFVPFIVNSYQKVYGNVYSNVSQVYKTPYSTYIENLLPSPTLTYTTLVTTGQLPGGPTVTPAAARDAIFQPAFITDVATNNSNGLYVDAQANDLLAWNPRSRMLMCGGSGDPTVPPAVHMQVAQAGFTARGLVHVTSVDVDPLIRATYGVGGAAPTDPTSAAFATYYGSYHGTYEPPFCYLQARGLFDSAK